MRVTIYGLCHGSEISAAELCIDKSMALSLVLKEQAGSCNCTFFSQISRPVSFVSELHYSPSWRFEVGGGGAPQGCYTSYQTDIMNKTLNINDLFKDTVKREMEGIKYPS